MYCQLIRLNAVFQSGFLRGYGVTYQVLMSNEGFPEALALLTLEELTGAPSAIIKKFIVDGLAPAQAAAHAQAIAQEPAAARARVVDALTSGNGLFAPAQPRTASAPEEVGQGLSL